ncbi:protein NUCLEAR FUSION DEFECTIVE 4-like [Lotus japonicus]|uniref:protein NUCLEAR FUSION DEFECTIVE 4-like n=1 Tax=Lotus japonicus TaxID=34305 RepID=UPI002590AFD4|nr:protein NUCLEAR FUSION DEFECTIVE 4-like [Lotus japonicus]
MSALQEKFVSLYKSRWLVFVASMWLQSWGNVGYLFGSISPVIKSSLNYNQKQVAMLGVAKDLGGTVGYITGILCAVLPMWGALLVGAALGIIGYGWVWMIVTAQVPALPLWAMCVLIFVGTNFETYCNTVALVSCVQSFPQNRGPVVGILKGFGGLSGAILIQIYLVFHSPDPSSLILMVAVGPPLIAIALMFIVRPVEGHKQVKPSDGKNFTFVYGVCLLLAAYLIGVMVVQDLVDLSQAVTTVFTVILILILIVPIVIPISLSFGPEQKPLEEEEESLLPESPSNVPGKSQLMDIDDDELGVKKRRGGPQRGEDFTLTQALVNADFWLLFISTVFGGGSGLTVIDNLGQMSQSLGYDNAHIFVSLIGIWSFLGRVGGGYISEIVVRNVVYPRPAALAVFQLVMIVGHLIIGMGWPGALYVGTLLVGLGYGAHWAIVPATASELFGLRNFGALYNFITLANPAGTLIFSSLIASRIYDYEAEKQAHIGSLALRMLNVGEPLKCEGYICFFLTSIIMAGSCLIAAGLCMIVVFRTRIVYAKLYEKSSTSRLQ